MIIRKKFDFENAHIVRNCSSKRCRESIHGHSYRVEVLLESHFLDNAGIVYDFGFMRGAIRDIIDSFDHATTVWSGDDENYVREMKKISARWVELPFNPSAEQFSRVIFALIDRVLSLTQMQNGERGVRLNSVIVHETGNGYAQCFREDVENENMGKIEFDKIKFSPQVMSEWDDPKMMERIILGQKFINPKEC